jgi:hypothetical protein
MPSAPGNGWWRFLRRSRSKGGRGLPHSKTSRKHDAPAPSRSVLECGGKRSAEFSTLNAFQSALSGVSSIGIQFNDAFLTRSGARIASGLEQESSGPCVSIRVPSFARFFP